MADYLPLISRAVANLPDDTPEARAAIYDRARSALDQQLRSLNPPLPEADIVRERVALDEAIAQIEHERYVAAREAEYPPIAPETGLGDAAGRDEPYGQGGDFAHGYPENLPRLPDRDDEHDQAAGAHADETAANIPDALRGAGATFQIPGHRAETGFPEQSAAEVDQRGRNGSRTERPRLEAVAPRPDRSHRWRSIIVALVLGTVIAGIAAIAFINRDNTSEPPPRVAQADQPPQADRKFGDRVGGDPAPPGGRETANGQAQPSGPAANGAPAPSTATRQPPNGEVVPVAQRAILYEESPDNPRVPIAFNGTAVWRLESVNVGQGQQAETAVRADVDIPGAGMTLTMILRRNTDPTLPASHLVQLTFTLAGDAAAGRTVRDVGVLQMKADENARGTPLAGLPVPVTPNVFLVGLSSIRGDTERNIEALKTQPWMDLPVRFANGRRGIIAIERGISGQRTLNEAFAIWGN